MLTLPKRYINHDILIKFWIAAVFAGAVYCLVPISDTFKFCADEGPELAKALLYHKGFHLYTEIWDDEPPLFTMLLSALFRSVGISVIAARLMALAFASILIASFYGLVLRTSGRIAAIVAVFSLIVSPLFLQISVCVMQEIPTIATALMAIAFLFRWENQPRQRWLFISGVIMGCAIQIKLTAMLLLPAAMALILIGKNIGVESEFLKCRIRSLLLWLSGIFISFSTILFSAGGAMQNIKTTLLTHFPQVADSTGIDGSWNYPFDFTVMAGHIEVVAAAAFGIVLICWHGEWYKMRFPFIFLVTSFVTLVVHRPFWNYYYFYVSIPMIWLGAHAVARGLRAVALLKPAGHRTLFATTKQLLPFAISIVLCFFLIIRGGSRFVFEFTEMERREGMHSDPLVGKIMLFRHKIQWFYTSEALYAAHANIAIPPELAVISLKRYWTGQITDAQIFGCVARYRPELVLLYLNETFDPLWKPFLEANYISVFQDDRHALFISKRLQDIPVTVEPKAKGNHDENRSDAPWGHLERKNSAAYERPIFLGRRISRVSAMSNSLSLKTRVDSLA